MSSSGYGCFAIETAHIRVVNTSAHRVAYVLAHGDLPPGLLVMHACDVPLCVNPAHLSAGTDTDNLRDAYAKGRVKNRPYKVRKDDCKRHFDRMEA